MSASIVKTSSTGDGDFYHEPVLEGFLCPICKADLKTPDLLTAHVDAAHSEQDQDLIRSFRGMLLSAKQKIRNEFSSTAAVGSSTNDAQGGRSSPPSSSSSSSTSTAAGASASTSPASHLRYTSAYPPIFATPSQRQQIGTDLEHTGYFNSVRAVRLERYATETNKLLIRLHKMLSLRPVDGAQRRQLEQHLVPWMDGKLVRLCPGCAKRFLLTRRQHHCRLCGSIMCAECSRFLDLRLAAELCNPVADSPTDDVMANGFGSNDNNSDSADTVSQRSDRPAAGSEGTAADEAAADEAAKATLRCCSHCLHLLSTRQDQLESRTLRPPICALYDRIERLKAAARPDCATYAKIVASLLSGDTVFQLGDAGALRARIGHVAEQLDALSKALLTEPTPRGSQAERLQRFVRLACVQYIKDQMLGLDALPTAEVVEEKQRKRRQEAEQRIERERRLALEEWERRAAAAASANGTETAVGDSGEMASRQRNGNSGKSSGSAVTSLDNWSGQQQANVVAAGQVDVLVEQINNIKGYIRQARDVLRFEEVETLERNLRELQHEFYERQQEAGLME